MSEIDTTFPPVSEEEWLAKAPGKNAEPFPAMPTTTIEDGIDVPWLFTPDDALAPDPAGTPDQAPFVRTSRPDGQWDIRQEHAVADRRALNKVLLEDLEGGATGMTLRLDEAARDAIAPADEAFAQARGVDGAAISDLADLQTVLEGVYSEMAGVALDAGGAAVPAAALLVAAWRERGHDLATVPGALRIDPVGTLAEQGELPEAPADAVRRAGAIAAEAHTLLPAVTSLAVDTRAYADAGATAVQELALAAATGALYLRACDDAGLAPGDAAGRIEFTLQVGADQFAEIAKLRAWRRIWARILEVSGAPEAQRRSPLYARTARRVMADADPWVNMLRVTTATFAAGAGGADGISVAPFDQIRAQDAGATPERLGRRMARNTQLILQDESAVAKVADPAGGSWYVEWLTDRLARDAWAALQDIEGRGGVLTVLAEGYVSERIASRVAERDQEIAVRERELTGVTTFPLLGDDKVAVGEPVDTGALAQRDRDKTAERGPLTVEAPPAAGEGQLEALADAAARGARIDELSAALYSGAAVHRSLPFPVQRDARAFERLRRLAAAADEEPRVLLACLGPIAQHTAVATWTRAYFETAGIRAIASDPIEDPAQAADALREHTAPLAVVCSGARDDEAPARIAATVAALRDAGARTIYVAGVSRDAAEEAGADASVRRGDDLLDVLSRALADCGVNLEALA